MAQPENALISRLCGSAILGLLAVEFAVMPYTGHSFDTGVFFAISDSVFFAHVPPTDDWAFGAIGLVAVLLSQFPVLVNPALATIYPVRLFLLKLPSWLADLATAAIVRRASDEAYGNYWALRYLLDPAVILVTVFHGQWDALPSFASVAGIALMMTGKLELSAVLLGLGAGTKFYPAAFVPLLLAVAMKSAGPRRAAIAFAVFAATACATLLPAFWGRFDYVVHAYTANSFGSGAGIFTFSMWSLLPDGFAPSPRIEQLAAVSIPIALAALELRHLPERRDVARTAMFTAMSIVLLNPGAHPPFYIWIAGPLVLYAAVANDGLVSLGGIVLSAAAVMIQFCLEGSDEYFLQGATAGRRPDVLQCMTHRSILEFVILGAATFVVICAVRVDLRSRIAANARFFAQIVAALLAILFLYQIEAGIASMGGRRGSLVPKLAAGTFGVLSLTPSKRPIGTSCTLSYESYGSTAFASGSYAQRFLTASLGYSLFSHERIAIHGRELNADSLPSRYERLDVTPFDGAPIRVTREFDITRYAEPVMKNEVIVESPCSLIPESPLLIYRLDVDAARAAAARRPLSQRLNIFSQEPPKTMGQ